MKLNYINNQVFFWRALEIYGCLQNYSPAEQDIHEHTLSQSAVNEQASPHPCTSEPKPWRRE